MEAIVDSGHISALNVLKRFGDGNDAPLSFPSAATPSRSTCPSRRAWTSSATCSTRWSSTRAAGSTWPRTRARRPTGSPGCTRSCRPAEGARRGRPGAEIRLRPGPASAPGHGLTPDGREVRGGSRGAPLLPTPPEVPLRGRGAEGGGGGDRRSRADPAVDRAPRRSRADRASVHADLTAWTTSWPRPGAGRACARDIAARAERLGRPRQRRARPGRGGRSRPARRRPRGRGRHRHAPAERHRRHGGRGRGHRPRLVGPVPRLHRPRRRPTALEHALDAVAAFSDDVPQRLRTRVLLTVADLLDELGGVEDARTWYSRPRSSRSGTRSCTCGSSTTAPTASWTAGTP